MAKSPFFSIVMPVYNVALYLEKAAQSVLNQTFKDLELILVDDCSTDGSDEICKKLQAQDTRVVYERLSQNSGAAAARNHALKKAKGIYVGFVDSDDFIDLDLLEKAYSFLKDEKYECLKFGCIEEYYSKSGKLIYTQKCVMPESEWAAGSELCDQIVKMETIPLFGYAWNGFYSKAITAMPGMDFNENLKVNEDFDFNIRFFRRVKRLKCMADSAYHYAKRSGGSLSGEEKNYHYEAQMMKIRALIQLYPNVDLISKEIREKIFWMYTRFVYALLVRAKRMGKCRETEEKVYRDLVYKQFCETEFPEATGKQKLMTQALKNPNGVIFRTLFNTIYVTKTYLPILFSMVKK